MIEATVSAHDPEYGIALRVALGQGQRDIVVTEPDVARLLQAKAAIAAGILISFSLLGEREVRQGLGWRLPQPQWSGSPRAFTHGGISGGRLWVEPEAGFAVAFLTNRWQAPIEVSLSVIDAVYRAWRR